MSGWDAFGHLSQREKILAGGLMRIDPATVIGPVIGIIVDEMPARNGHPDMALFPYPSNSRGGRLHKLSKLTLGEYLGRLRRVFLFKEHSETWDPIQARLNAIEITQSLLPGTRLIASGWRVGRAFDLGDKYFAHYEHGGSRATCIPDIGGRSVFYTDSNVRAATGLAIRWAADLRKR